MNGHHRQVPAPRVERHREFQRCARAMAGKRPRPGTGGTARPARAWLVSRPTIIWEESVVDLVWRAALGRARRPASTLPAKSRSTRPNVPEASSLWADPWLVDA